MRNDNSPSNRGPRRRRLPGFRALLLASLATLTLAAACGGETSSPDVSDDTGQLTPVVVSSDLAVGQNRFALGLIEQNTIVLDADLHLRFLKRVGENQAELRFEADSEFVGFETFFLKESTGEKVTTGETGVYVANVEFDEAGDWGLEVTGLADGHEIPSTTLAFTVLEEGQTLSVGDPAPRSLQRIESDVQDVTEIETMVPPDAMHDVTIADAVGSGKPVVVVFGTPAFCETQTCGPVMQTVMVPLRDKYGQQATFIHVEPFFVEEARNGVGFCPVPAFNAQFAALGLGEGPGDCAIRPVEEIDAAGESWNLTTEPILFIIDGNGIIRGKFEGIVGPQEVEAALLELL